ncbi:uncharacterized protein BXZ73DRAFT_103657 [Epithele typhae]|uniref:uncharacterized protein n=1 Tax=Epithele typhae TaxID=378194 RepID=UPI002008AE5C|nr:uncharacterized protein BXZ73DRAFT_103657 [Epithele typhae]KAH9923922.1 hypothetical protein BXZ73DRAFT_103657 [Epithele typhae]
MFVLAAVALVGLVIPNADPGDVITFTFKQKNHTVTQSSLNAPCSFLEGGFDSGFVPIADDQTTNFTVAQFLVEDTQPVWVYCRQTGHCQKGMVFAINPGNNFDTFMNNALGTASASSSTSAVATSSVPAISTQAPSSVSVITVTATTTVNGAAQTTTYTTASSSSSSAAASPSGAAVSHVVMVGGNGALEFTPRNLSAAVGDRITFQFADKNHTATQSSFADPCAPLGATSASGQVGFDSGFMPASAAAVAPVFTVTVNDTAPIWVFCKQTNPKSHCNAGMVFVLHHQLDGQHGGALSRARAAASSPLPSSSARCSSSDSELFTTSASSGTRRLDA